MKTKLFLSTIALSTLIFTGCGGGSSSSGTATVPNTHTPQEIDMINYMPLSPENDTASDSKGNIVGRWSSHVYAYWIGAPYTKVMEFVFHDDVVSFYDTKINRITYVGDIYFPRHIKVNKDYQTEEGPVIKVLLSGDTLILTISLYENSELIVYSEYYYSQDKGLYKIVFNDTVTVD